MKIKCKNLQKTFRSDNQIKSKVINNLSFSLNSSESMAIFGPSGVGKSTLINLLTGLDSPDKGDIYYDNLCFSQLNQDQKTRFRLNNISIIFQNFNLLADFNVLENVMLPLRYQGHGKKDSFLTASDILEKVNLKEKFDCSINTLSGGETQRVGIARALAMKPKIIFADEPTGNLDTESSKKILSEIIDICSLEKITLFFASHDNNLLEKITNSRELNNGTFI